MIIPTIIDQIIFSLPGYDIDERKFEKMETKYGTVTEEQVSEYKKQLHAMIHWLLVYKEKNYEDLDNYFSSVLFRINGLNSILNYPPNMLGLMTTLESARLENLNPEYDHKKYRKAILDAHAIIDRIGEVYVPKNNVETCTTETTAEPENTVSKTVTE